MDYLLPLLGSEMTVFILMCYSAPCDVCLRVAAPATLRVALCAVSDEQVGAP